LWWCCHFSYWRYALISCEINRSLKLSDEELVLEIVELMIVLMMARNKV
jgi:hypothetical protein